VWLISLAGGSSEPIQGSWAYLGPRGITPGAVAQFLGALHREFPRAESVKSFVSTATSKDILSLLCGE
jgi:hypothetical protein